MMSFLRVINTPKLYFKLNIVDKLLLPIQYNLRFYQCAFNASKTTDSRLIKKVSKNNIIEITRNSLYKMDFKSLHNSSLNLMKIYTKTGDKGNTSTFAGDRRSKTDAIFEALGTIDELTSCIGLVREYLNDSEPIKTQLFGIQCVLQDLAASVATPKSRARAIHLERTKFEAGHVKTLEEWIDKHTAALPELTNFIIPSGGKAGSHLHLARAICRRAERKVVPIVEMNEVDTKVLIYLNRLSDYLFTVARVAAKHENKLEEIYVKPMS